MHVFEANGGAEQLGCHVQEGAFTVAAERNFARVGFQMFDELRSSLERRTGVHHQGEIVSRYQSDRREVFNAS